MKLRWNWKRWPLAALAFASAAAPALAHEKWYVDHRGVEFTRSVFSYVSPVFAAAIIVLAAAAFLGVVWLDRRFDGSAAARWLDLKLVSYKFNPRTVLGVAIGVSLMGAGLQGTLFSPSLVLGGDPWSIALAMTQIALGSLFLFLEPAYSELGFLLVLLFLAGLPVVPFWDLMEELFMLGAGLFFLTTPSERTAWKPLLMPDTQRLGYQAFRIIVGLNFLVLSGVKWLHPEFAISLVGEYHINFLSAFGASDAHFVFIAAVVETVVALCILLRAAFRPAATIGLLLFLISIYFFGFKELLGHLPVKAALFLFLVYGHWHKGEQKG